jgi:triosephosphate isomerase
MASRKPIVAGNWKMNGSTAFATQMAEPITEQQCHIGVAPISIALLSVQKLLKDAHSPVKVVAQDLSQMPGTGAYTGEVSAELLKDSQIDYVLIGHSERREIFGDDVGKIKAKLSNALNAGLQVIYCVGESLEQREAGQAEQVVLQQICDLAAVVKAEQWHNIVIAYEPIWAIGTGKTASRSQICCKTTCSACPASRCSRLSPTQ